MKTYLLPFILSIMFWSCSEKIEVIPNYDEEYAVIGKDKLPQQIVNDGEQNKPVPFDIYLQQLLSKSSLKMKNNLNEMEYRLYINENGKVEKVKVQYGQPENIDYENIKMMEEWHFSPYKTNNKPEKFGYYLVFKIDSSNGRPELQNTVTESRNKRPDETDYFLQVEQMPMIIGGIEAVLKEIKYPEDARKQKLEGRVLIRAFIDETGKVTYTEVIKGIGGSCDRAALNAVDKISFIPGKQNEKNVKTQVVIPVMFKLN